MSSSGLPETVLQMSVRGPGFGQSVWVDVPHVHDWDTGTASLLAPKINLQRIPS